MALQIWLPLNGNIENKGLLGDLTVTATPTFADAGKIGKCLSSGSLSMSAEQTQQVLNNDEFTFATWLYLNSDTGSGSTAIFGNEGMTAPNNRRFTVFLYDTLQKVHLSWQNYDSNSTVVGTVSGAIIPLKQWTHLAVTYSKSSKVVKVYLNGAVKESYNVSGDFTSQSYAYVTRLMPNNSSIKYNDYRVYSHCLSPKEIKEISKGLVLHYPMNNCNIDANNLLNNASSYREGTPYTCTTTSTDGYFHTNMYYNNDSLGGQIVTFSVSTNKQIASSHGGSSSTHDKVGLWLYLKKTAYSSPDGSYDTPINLNSSNNNFKSLGNNRYSWTYTIPSGYKGVMIRTNLYSNNGSSVSADFWDFQLEFGSKASPFSPNKWTSTTVYDCSGFGYNGTVTSASAPILDSDSPRYNSSFKFDTTAKYITTAIDPTGYKDTYSIAWWGNIPNFGGAMFWGFNNTMNWYDGKYWNQGDGGNNPFYSSGTTTITPPSTNTWHHYVITGDGSVTKLYVDGALYGTAKTYRAIGGTSLQINGWPNDANYRIPGMKMSDFRIYATPLSVEDIKELYNTSTVICDNGTVMAYSLEE